MTNFFGTDDASQPLVDLSNDQAAFKTLLDFQRTHQSKKDKLKAQFDDLNNQSRKALYQTLGAFFAIARELMKSENAPVLRALLAKHGIKPARKGSNPYTPITSMCFGRWKELSVGKTGKGSRARIKHNGVVWEFIPNASSAKYARAAQWFEFKEWKPSEVATKLEDYPKRLVGVITDAQNEFGRSDVDVLVESKLLSRAVSAEPFTTIKLSQTGIAPNKAVKGAKVALWAIVTDGGVAIKGSLGLAQATIEADLARQAKAKLKTLDEQQLAELRAEAEQESEEIQVHERVLMETVGFASQPEMEFTTWHSENAA